MKTINISFTDLAIASELKDVMRGRKAIKIGNLEFFGVDLNFHCNGGYMKASEAVRLPWNGEGLPPVGIPCEWHSDFQTGWQVVTVLAYHGDQAWIQPEGRRSIIVGNPANFRPIRTPEQIAAEERESTVQQMIKDIGVSDTDGWDHLRCAALYDAGYRKITE